MMGATYLRAGKWGPAVKATTRSIVVDPGRGESYRWWLASLGGPWTLRVGRRVLGEDTEKAERRVKYAGSDPEPDRSQAEMEG